MADSIRVFDPGFRVTDTDGNPVSGAKLKFYNAGGLVARTVYSDDDLSVSLGSTVTCDSSGAPAASSGSGGKVLIYTGTTSYKIVITDPDDVTLFEFDNITGALDTSSFESDTALPRSPVILKSTDYTIVDGDRGKVINVDSTGGDVAITMPSAVTVGDNWLVTVRHIGTSNDVAISASGGQTINDSTTLTLLYKYESVTLVSDGANWHVSEDGFVRRPAGSILPQGYLTPTSATPVITGDVSAASAVYYTPFVGSLIPLYSGTRYVPYEFTELTLTLVSQHEASAIYDVFVFLDGSTVRIGTGPKWSSATAGSGSRGSGANTTELERVGGLLLNKVSMTARNGTDTYTVAANRGTYVGSLFIDSTQGQVTCHRTVGQSRKWGIWNAYNRQLIRLLMTDSTGSWSYTGGAVRQSNASTGNAATAFCGLAEEWVSARFNQNVRSTDGSSSMTLNIGIGLNSTTTYSGFRASVQIDADDTYPYEARLEKSPSLGVNNFNTLENTTSARQGTFLGGEEDMLLTLEWRG